jgi:DNA-binding SARP family transcriptional activator
MDSDLAVHVMAGAEQTSRPVIHLFDGPYVTFANRRVQGVPEGSKRLLAFVAIHYGRAVERRQAAGALWPKNDERRAAGNLRSSLWRLRGAGIDVLRADKWSLRLQDGVLVDVQLTLEWANRIISNTTHSGDLATRPYSVGALRLLPGFYDDWTIIERERIRQRVLHALEALSHLLGQAGRYADAVDAALTAVNAEPLRESAQRALIEAHIAERNWVEARRMYIAYRDLVRRELGVEPSSELTDLISGRPRCDMPISAGQRPALATLATG